MAALVLSASPASAQDDELLVTNVQAQQRPGTHLVDVTYDLHTVDGMAVTVSLALSPDGSPSFVYLCLAVTGDVGAGVLPGTEKHIIWDAETDFPDLSSSTCQLRVTAADGVSDVPAEFVAIPAGTFRMGSPTTEPGHVSLEFLHWVTLTHGFEMQTTEVTNQQYRDSAQWAYDHGYCTATSTSLGDDLDGSTQELLDLDDEDCEIAFSGGAFTVDVGKEDHPVKEVTWYGSVAYCDWLSLQQGLPRAYDHSTWQCNGGNPYTAAGYRLPMEAEWEYACRAGTSTPFHTGSCLDAGEEANYDGTAPQSGCPDGPYELWTMVVGSYPANGFGLHDMHGNSWEWCNDFLAPYSSGPVTDPTGPGTGTDRVIRGGCFVYTAEYCRSAFRIAFNPPHGSVMQSGFRPVRSSD